MPSNRPRSDSGSPYRWLSASPPDSHPDAAEQLSYETRAEAARRAVELVAAQVDPDT